MRNILRALILAMTVTLACAGAAVAAELGGAGVNASAYSAAAAHSPGAVPATANAMGAAAAR
jgi:hypothetical protein